MRIRRFFPWLLTLSLVLPAYYAEAQKTSARSQLRRTVDPSERSAYGTVTMTKDANQQTFQVDIQGLGEDEFGIFLSAKPTFDTNCCVEPVALLGRTNAKKGTWSRKLVATGGGAPLEFVDLGALDLDDLAGTEIDISQPGVPNISTIATNIVGGVTNIVGGVTNIVGNTTNVIFGINVPTTGQTGTVFSALWAPLPALTAKPTTLSHSAKAILVTPAAPAPSPDAKGTVKVRFIGSQGRSVLDLRATKLIAGQKYTVYIADAPGLSYILIPAGEMTPSKNGSSQTFLRDTRFADPLPQQVRDISDLSGRVIDIRDGFLQSHLTGVIP